jgi:hypothetical protein
MHRSLPAAGSDRLRVISKAMLRSRVGLTMYLKGLWSVYDLIVHMWHGSSSHASVLVACECVWVEPTRKTCTRWMAQDQD